MGEKFRNELMHGFVDDPTDSLATLVFVAILFLALRVTFAAKDGGLSSSGSATGGAAG